MSRHTNKQKKAKRAAERAATAGSGATRSRVSGVVEKAKEVLVGTANEATAPGAYQQIFRYSQLSVGTAGGARNINDIWATFLADMDVQGMPSEGLDRLKALGGKNVLNTSRLDPAVVASLSDSAALVRVKESHRLAQAAVKGLTGGKTGARALDLDWAQTLDDFAKEADFLDANGKRALAELRKVDPKVIAKIGSNQALSVMARRGEDPFWVRQWNKLFKRQNTATLPAGMVEQLKQSNAGQLPKIGKGTLAALAEGGGAGLKGGVGRKAIGLLGRTGGGAAFGAGFLALEANRLVGIAGRQGRADTAARLGFQQLGASSSVELLRNQVEQQEQLSRRKVILKQFHPELFQEVVRILATNEQPGTLTATERRIGSNAQEGAVSRSRPPEDVSFLLDELFKQVSGAGGQ